MFIGVRAHTASAAMLGVHFVQSCAHTREASEGDVLNGTDVGAKGQDKDRSYTQRMVNLFFIV